MKKFLFEYKAFRGRLETSKDKCERVTVSSLHASPGPSLPTGDAQTSPLTIRTEAYKRDLAEFQARRSKELPDTPVKKSGCGRNSLPTSCTDCASPNRNNTFTYEERSAMKYRKHSHKRSRSATADGVKDKDRVPNVQFLFQNQVFMPGNVFERMSRSEPPPARTKKRHDRRHGDARMTQKQLDFSDDVKFAHDSSDDVGSPLFYKDNALPVDSGMFLNGYRDVCKSPNDNVSSQGTYGDDTSKDSCEEKLKEVMMELKNFDQWADEQLKMQSVNSSKSDDSKSDASANGLQVVDLSNLDVTMDKNRTWNHGHWGIVPIQIKKLPGVTVAQVKRKQNIEINLLRKFRHPNIVLLMGLFPDMYNVVHLICEQCVDTLYGIIHVQGRILSAQTAVQYASDVASALTFLHMQGYVHTELNSISVMVTAHGAAKLTDLSPCAKYPGGGRMKSTDNKLYGLEPLYINIEEVKQAQTEAGKPLISTDPSEVYLSSYSVTKDYKSYRNSEHYRWHAPELFSPDDNGMVHPCSKSDVYSLSMILWECCNALVPWKSMSYEKIKELYVVWKARVHLPVDGTYPGCLLDLLQNGLKIDRVQRIDLKTMAERLQVVKRNIDNLEYMVIPARMSKRKSGGLNGSPVAWDAQSPTDSEPQSPIQKNVTHKADIHKSRDSSSESSKHSDTSHLYERIQRLEKPIQKLADNYSSACSTPISKVRARLVNVTPGNNLHRSDSTEYCSILSPDNRSFNINKESETTVTKLSSSFTPKSYKPLHIRVPEYKNLDRIKALPKGRNGLTNTSTYNFDIQNYSLPNTPIARSNKLRKNAWLSGELDAADKSDVQAKEMVSLPVAEDDKESKFASHISAMTISSTNKDNLSQETDEGLSNKPYETTSPETEKDFIILKRTDAIHFEDQRDSEPFRPRSWSVKSLEPSNSGASKLEEDALAHVNVKPLVKIHERWIHEAGMKTGRSMSLPDDNRSQIPALKPASHCIDTLQKSLPQLPIQKPETTVCKSSTRSSTSSTLSGASRNEGQSEQFSQARDVLAKCMTFATKDAEQQTWRSSITPERQVQPTKTDQSTDTTSIEEFIRELIRKEVHELVYNIDNPSTAPKYDSSEDLINKGTANVLENLNKDKEKDNFKSFSRVKIHGNNKPLLQITFSRNGENSLHVLDSCVNVTISDANTNTERVNPNDDASVGDFHSNSLKRCQAFHALQEARSTEDLYIDDDFSTQMQENFGGKVKLIPLHGSLHEILCEREDECCLIKVKQENGCDTIYFKCDNSDTESRDAIDGTLIDNGQDTVVFKRSISLVEERIQRVYPKEKRHQNPVPAKKHLDVKLDKRPKSEGFLRKINNDTRVLSNSSPSLIIDEKADEIELNIENVMCYQDSSSDECLKCYGDDEFETLERKIEEDVAKANFLGCGCLEKISEENLSVINDELTEKELSSNGKERELYID